jgi:hypothetical protein
MFKSINDWLAGMMAEYLSSMSCFWVITTMVVVVLFWQRPVSLVGWITYISTAIFQASALPILGFVSKKEGAKSQQLMQETHDTVMKEFSMVQESLADAKETLVQIHQLIKDTIQ